MCPPVRDAFNQNLIGSPRLPAFFSTFSPTILTNLKRLYLHDLHLNAEHRPVFVRILNSFSRLEELHITQFYYHNSTSPNIDVELNLPMLRSIHLNLMGGFSKLTLDTPRLQAIKLWDCLDLSLVIIHGESVERLLIDLWRYLPVKNLKNLQHLHVESNAEIDPTFLSDLKQLSEISLGEPHSISNLFEQKQRYGRADLKIYRFGCLLNGPEDPVISIPPLGFDSAFTYLTENPTRLADEMPFWRNLQYWAIEPVVTESANLLKRFIDLETIIVTEPVESAEDVQRFLDLLKSLDITVELWFDGDQPQDLFDRLPEHYAARSLYIDSAPSNHQFVFRMKGLVRLQLEFPVDIETIRKAFEELPLLCSFKFWYLNNEVRIEIGHSKRFEVSVNEEKKKMGADLNAAIEFIVENVIEREIEDDGSSEEEEEDMVLE